MTWIVTWYDALGGECQQHFVDRAPAVDYAESLPADCEYEIHWYGEEDVQDGLPPLPLRTRVLMAVTYAWILGCGLVAGMLQAGLITL